MELVWFTTAARTSVTAEEAFARVVPRDDATLFHRHRGLPGVASVSGASGSWDAPGRHRTVHLDDGGSFREEIVRFEPPSAARAGHFDYAVSDFAGPLKLLVSDGLARWEYRPLRSGSLIRWSYGYRPLRGRSFVVRGLVGPLWRSYMRAGLAECVRVAEGA